MWYTNLCEISHVSSRLSCKTSLLTENPPSTLLWQWHSINMILQIYHRSLNWLSFAKYKPRNVSRWSSVKLHKKTDSLSSKLAAWINLSNWFFAMSATWAVILSNEYSLSAYLTWILDMILHFAAQLFRAPRTKNFW